jgi:predicted cation transporter
MALNDIVPPGMYIFGDSGFKLDAKLIKPFRQRTLEELERDFNVASAKVRVTIEMGFGLLVQRFPMLNVKEYHKIGSSPVGLVYVVATILSNMFTCLHKCSINSVFDLSPPNLLEYMSCSN